MQAGEALQGRQLLFGGLARKRISQPQGVVPLYTIRLRKDCRMKRISLLVGLCALVWVSGCCHTGSCVDSCNPCGQSSFGGMFGKRGGNRGCGCNCCGQSAGCGQPLMYGGMDCGAPCGSCGQSDMQTFAPGMPVPQGGGCASGNCGMPAMPAAETTMHYEGTGWTTQMPTAPMPMMAAPGNLPQGTPTAITPVPSGHPTK
jgi:hypothetical protein